VSPALLTLALATDTALAWTEGHCTRMARLLQAFLREIGRPMAVPDGSGARAID
jgi:hypothetical protein